MFTKPSFIMSLGEPSGFDNIFNNFCFLKSYICQEISMPKLGFINHKDSLERTKSQKMNKLS